MNFYGVGTAKIGMPGKICKEMSGRGSADLASCIMASAEGAVHANVVAGPCSCQLGKPPFWVVKVGAVPVTHVGRETAMPLLQLQLAPLLLLAPFCCSCTPAAHPVRQMRAVRARRNKLSHTASYGMVR